MKKVGAGQESTARQAQEWLVQARDCVEGLRQSYTDPQFGINRDEEAGRLCELFEKLDNHLVAGYQYPEDWL